MAKESPSGPAGANREHAPSDNLSTAASHVEAGAKQALADTGLNGDGPSLATIVLVGAGVAIIEPELIPGMLIGAGAWLAPKLLPALGGILRPVVKGVVKTGYSVGMTVRQAVAEAGEHVEDMVAEARSEYHAEHAVPAHNEASVQAGAQRRQPRASRGTN